MRTVVIFGSQGALGQVIEEVFLKSGWHCWGISPRFQGVSPHVVTSVKNLPPHLSVDAVVCAAGAFEANVPSADATLDQLNRLWLANVVPSFEASHLAAEKKSKTLVLTGSLAAFRNSTRFACAYGSCKAAVHSLAQTCFSKSTPPPPPNVYCLLPDTLDTPRNRIDMPTADFQQWTSTHQVALRVLRLCEGEGKEKDRFVTF